MSDRTQIEWCDATWSPVTGCTKVSPGCDHCYAERIMRRFGHDHQSIQLHPERLNIPLKWKRPRRIFVCSVSDLFHPRVPWDFVDKVFTVMEDTPQHTYQLLTKRPGRMAFYASDIIPERAGLWPANVWAGTSVEQEWWGNKRLIGRLDALARVPAKVRFVSLEPLLGPVDLRPYVHCPQCAGSGMFFSPINALANCLACGGRGTVLDWVIVGGESGPKARPMHPDWVRSVRDQCQAAAGIPFFFKAWGEWCPCTLGRDEGWPGSKPENAWMYERLLNPGGGYAGRPSDRRIKIHWWNAMESVWRVGRKAAGATLDGREYRECPNEST